MANMVKRDRSSVERSLKRRKIGETFEIHDDHFAPDTKDEIGPYQQNQIVRGKR